MKKACFLFVLSFLLSGLHAQSPVLKIDVNVDEARKESEVNEPGYTPWKIGKDIMSSSATFEGVQFSLSCVEATGGQLRGSWAKVMVQGPYYARLTCDGANIDYASQTMEAGGKLLLEIAGLPLGTHTLQTMHNSWQDPTSKAPSPMKVYLDGELIHDSVSITSRALTASEATVITTILHVTDEDQVIKLLFEAVSSFTPPAGVNPNYNVWLNAIELNTVDISKLAKDPFPIDADMHVDADSGSLMITWSPASDKVEKHYLYLGTELEQIENAKSSDANLLVGIHAYGDTSFLLADAYSMNTYYWRVDELDRDGVLTKGNVWSFRPRQLAFRGAEGYGRFATGGRGGKVVYVTNLNANGPGSFRYCVENEEGPRTILFAVSGIIPLNGRIVCGSHVTIAGQTAPGKGICFRGGAMGFGSDNITRFIRNRVGSGTTYDGMGLRGGNHSIVDHCSISWSIDEGFSSREAKNITLQRTMIAEALNVANHDKYGSGSEHGFSAVFGGDIGSFHHNVMAHARGRNPRMDGGMDGAGYYTGRLDIFNNVVYNWSSYGGNGEAHEANFVNNYYKQGPASPNNNRILVADVNQRGSNKGTESYYYAGNALASKNGTLIFDGTQPHGESGKYGGSWQLVNSMPVDWTVWVDRPFFPSYAKIETARDAYKSVLSDVGCTLPVFDEHDQRIVREIKEGSYTYIGGYTGKPGVIDSEADAGGFEDYGNEVRPENFDSDWDGLPDWWEILHGSNPHSPRGDFSDANADPDKDGYTALEDYLEWMANPHYYTRVNTSKTIDLAPYTMGYTKAPVYTLVAIEQGATVHFEGSKATVTPAEDFKGILYFDFCVSDSEGSKTIRRIGLLVDDQDPSAIPQMEGPKIKLVVEGDYLIIQSEQALSQIAIYDMTGRCMMQQKADDIQSININTLSKGVYILSIKNQEEKPYLIKFFK